MTDLKEWLSHRAEERRRLYERYGKLLEKDHSGEYVAISLDGRTTVGQRVGDVLKRAIDSFGSGNFVLARIGHHTFGQWLNLTK